MIFGVILYLLMCHLAFPGLTYCNHVRVIYCCYKPMILDSCAFARCTGFYARFALESILHFTIMLYNHVVWIML